MTTQLKFIEMVKDYSKEELVILKDVITLLLKDYSKEDSSNKPKTSNVSKFIDELLNEEYNIDEKKWLSKKKITMSNLYEEYCRWCELNNEKYFSKNIFSRNIPKNKILERGKNRIDKKPRRWILFN